MRRSTGLPDPALVALLAAASLLAATPGRAEGAPLLNGTYVALGGGVVDLDDGRLDYGGAIGSGHIAYDPGWAVSGAVGSRVLDLYRIELEVSHRESDVNDTDVAFTTGGSFKATTYMVNGYVDIPVYTSGVVPYLGVGLGRAQFTQDIELFNGTFANSASHAFAWQVIGGMEFPLIPRRMSLTAEYRYLSSTSPLFQDRSGLYYHSDYDSHTLMLGLRWGF